jgi:hypothetical protein
MGTVDTIVISGADSDEKALDAVDPAGAEADRVADLGDVGHGVGDGVEDEPSISGLARLAQAVVRAEAAVAEVRDLPTYVDVRSLSM